MTIAKRSTSATALPALHTEAATEVETHMEAETPTVVAAHTELATHMVAATHTELATHTEVDPTPTLSRAITVARLTTGTRRSRMTTTPASRQETRDQQHLPPSSRTTSFLRAVLPRLTTGLSHPLQATLMPQARRSGVSECDSCMPAN